MTVDYQQATRLRIYVSVHHQLNGNWHRLSERLEERDKETRFVLITNTTSEYAIYRLERRSANKLSAG